MPSRLAITPGKLCTVVSPEKSVLDVEVRMYHREVGLEVVDGSLHVLRAKQLR